MPTEFIDLTTEFVQRYNQQLRKLEELGNVSTDSSNSVCQELRRQIEDLQRQVEEARRKPDETRQDLDEKRKVDTELARLHGELVDSRNQFLAAENELKTRKREAERSAALLNDRNDKLDKSRITTEEQERVILQLKETIKKLQFVTERDQGKSVPPEPALSPAELTKKLKIVREKLGTYTQRLREKRSSELSVISQLSPRQLHDFVDALSKELAGMMERYQLLSLWEKQGSGDGTENNNQS